MELSLSSKCIWCYSIYGDDLEKYYHPMLENIQLAKEFGAAIYLHTNKHYEKKVRRYFSGKINNIEDINLVVHDNFCATHFPKILRFLTPQYSESDFYFYKDSDSIVTNKEKVIMSEWMNSIKPTALIVRDHPLHIAPIMAGMFGANKVLSNKIAESAVSYFTARKHLRFNAYSYDQDWLARNIYPEIIRDAHVNTSFFYYSGERVKRINRETDGNKFIGAQVYKGSSYPSSTLDPYIKLYGDGLLSIPYFSRFAFLYGKVRPTIYIAYLINKIKKYYLL